MSQKSHQEHHLNRSFLMQSIQLITGTLGLSLALHFQEFFDLHLNSEYLHFNFQILDQQNQLIMLLCASNPLFSIF